YCNTVRNSTSNPLLPILIIGQQASTVHEIEAFRAGASEYIARPFDQNVLYYRITSRLGGINFYQTEPPKKSFDRLKIDTEGYTVHLDGKIINLSRKEFELLKMLHSKPGRVYSREEIFEKVWKKDPEASDRTIDVHILRLRKKLGNSFIGTQKGVGYRFSG
ncbi:MAG: response regulator transcription factor, partial [Bacteroidota bacterium]